MQVAVVLALLIAITISFSFWLVSRLVRSQAGVIQDRLESYVARGSASEPVRRRRRSMAASLDQVLRKGSFGRRLAEDLSKADLQLRVSEFAMLSVLAMVSSVLLGLLLFGTRVLALPIGFVGYFLPRAYVKMKQAQRLKAFDDQLADALRLIVSSLRSGYSMLQSLDVVATELPEPIASEFGWVVREIGIGLSHEEAFNNMLRRIESDDLDMVVTAINVQREVGGNLAEVLDIIGETISERVRIKGEIRALTAQQMLSGYLLSALPFIVAMVLFAINRPYMSQLFDDICGLLMLGVAILMIGVGFMLIRKIVRIEV